MLAVSFGFEVLRFRLLQKYYNAGSPQNLKTSKISKFPQKRLYLVGCVRLGNLKTDRLLWFYVRSKTSKPQKQENSLIKYRIFVGCCRLKTSKLINYCGFMLDRKPQNLKNTQIPHKTLPLLGCCRLGNLKTQRLLWFYVRSKTSKPQKMKNCCELLSKLRHSLDLKNFKTVWLM